MAAVSALPKRQEALTVFASLGQPVEARLRLLDLALGREIDRRIVGGVDHVLADADQLRGESPSHRPFGHSPRR